METESDVAVQLKNKQMNRDSLVKGIFLWNRECGILKEFQMRKELRIKFIQTICEFYCSALSLSLSTP